MRLDVPKIPFPVKSGLCRFQQANETVVYKIKASVRIRLSRQEGT